MTSSSAPLSLGEEFEPASREQWLRLVEKVLKGADFDKRLVSRTLDGIRIAPLYTRADAGTGTSAGSVMARAAGPWDIRQRHAELDPAAANAAILADLEGGVTSLLLQIEAPGQCGLPYQQQALVRALEGVHLELVPVVLDAGEYVTDAAGSLIALWRGRGIAEDRRLGAFHADPLGTLARTGALYHPLAASLANATQLVTTAMSMPRVTALLADGRPYHAAGASEAQELAAMLATLVAYLRACETGGIAPAAALRKIAVALAVDADQFLGLAKLRAARLLIGRLAEACGAGAAAGRVPLTAETSIRMMARRDPWVNLLRTSIACSAAAMGGADAITVLPFTAALGQPDAFARRIARNIQIVLMEEASLARVADPAAGSWYVENLTRDLAAKAWELFQQIEAKGGMGASLASGFVQDEIARVAEARRKDLATAREGLVGVSAFPKLGADGVRFEPNPAPLSAELNGCRVRRLAARRLAEPFEALRDRADALSEASGAPPRIFLAILGTIGDSATRASYTRNFFATAGIEAVGGEGNPTPDAAADAFAKSGATLACLCGSDAAYASGAEPAARALKAAGARQVYLAGRPGDRRAALEAAGIGGFIHVGVDVVAVLAEALDRLGAK